MDQLVEMISKKKIILWDFDGCFCDSEPIHLKAYSKAFSKYGHTINEAEYFYTFTHTGGGIQKEIENYNLICDPEEIKKSKAKYYWEFISKGEAKVFPEIPNILTKLEQLNIKSVIASNSLKEEIEQIILHQEKKISVENIFGLIPGLRKKPYPDIFNHALATLNIKPSEALVIEDSERGLLAAKEAFCDAIWIKTYLTDSLNSSAPYISKITHHDLLAALNAISK